MSIRKKLRLHAEQELHEMIMKLEGHALAVCADSPVEPKDLCRLVIGGKTQTTLNRVIGKIADRYEENYMAQLDVLPPDENY